MSSHPSHSFQTFWHWFNCHSNLKYFKKEMMFFEATQECPKALKRLKNCLDTFPPSSVEAERCFTAAGLFVTKLRSCISDYLIDLLCFTPSYLNQ